MTASRPLLSIVVVGFRMPVQLARTLHSLSCAYQIGVSEADYEVICVENASDRPLPIDVTRALPGNFIYRLRDEPTPTPVFALTEGIELARGQTIGIMIDGAHLLTPRVLHYAIMAFNMNPFAFVSVPTYHLGPEEQHDSTVKGYDEAAQDQLLASIKWPESGYRLFAIASSCGAAPKGFLAPMMESNCYFARRETLMAAGGLDMRYTGPGGGAVNLDLYRRLATHDHIPYIVLAGEGSFHQYHGGITSASTREEHAARFLAELQRHWDGSYDHVRRNPILFGPVAPQALQQLEYSAFRGRRYLANCRERGWKPWSDDQPPLS